MAKKKLTKAELMVDEAMLAMLEWASERPDRWHRTGSLETTKTEAELLAKRGVIEIWPETNLYRRKPPPSCKGVENEMDAWAGNIFDGHRVGRSAERPARVIPNPSQCGSRQSQFCTPTV
jgi:hypothetical protein